MLIRYNGEIMKEWIKSIGLGVIFLIIALVFIYLHKGITIWTALLIILATIDIIFGLIKKGK